MENGDETFASPTAAAAEFDEPLTNGGVADEGLTAAAHPAKLYDAAEIDALRKAKRDLEEKLAAVTHENNFLTAEARRLEGLLSQARDEITTAEQAAATSDNKILPLNAEVKRLEDLLGSEKSAHDPVMRKMGAIATEMKNMCQEKMDLDDAVKGLKASAAAAAGKKETAASSTVACKEAGVASHRLVAAAAAGAAATAAIAVVFLHLKR